MREVVIVDAVRSPVGRRNGSLSGKLSTDLLGDVLLGLIERNDLDPALVDQVVGGCVSQLGVQASNVIRNSWLGAGLPLEIPATTVNTQCGSSQQATTLGHGLVAGGLADVVVTCGVEVMSMVTMGANVSDPKFGHPHDGRYATYYESTTQFIGAERIAQKWEIDREAVDVFGKRSQDLAAKAWSEGRFTSQIIPIEAVLVDEAGSSHVKKLDRDEGLRETTLEGLAKLRTNITEPVPGVHTAGTSSQVCDGASAALLMTAERASQLGLQPRADRGVGARRKRSGLDAHRTDLSHRPASCTIGADNRSD